MLQTLGRGGNWDHTAMAARGPKGPLTIYLTPLCQPGSACRFSKIYLLLLGGGMGMVVLVIVNLFSSLLHLNTDLSQRMEASFYTSSSHIEIRTQLSLFLLFSLFFLFLTGEGWGRKGCWHCKESINVFYYKYL